MNEIIFLLLNLKFVVLNRKTKCSSSVYSPKPDLCPQIDPWNSCVLEAIVLSAILSLYLLMTECAHVVVVLFTWSLLLMTKPNNLVADRLPAHLRGSPWFIIARYRWRCRAFDLTQVCIYRWQPAACMASNLLMEECLAVPGMGLNKSHAY